MSSPGEIEIDGRNYPVCDGDTVLAVARRHDVYIPALCAHPLLKPYGACRLCLVELQQGSRTRLVASCAYPAQAGLVVRTATEKIKELRRGIMELLLARCPESAPVRALAAQLGVAGSRFPTLDRPAEACVLCGRCVRVCQEVVGATVIGFAHRGRERRVDSPFGLGSEACLGCCACVAVCPTGAVTAHYDAERLRLIPFNNAVRMVSCGLCGKPVGPLLLLGRVQARVCPPLTAEAICPECRAARHAEGLAQAARCAAAG